MSGGRRIAATFARLRAEGRAGLIPFITAGDPRYDVSLSLLQGLPAAGADIIELGVPFSDPMADGPAIQASSRRALRAGQTLSRTLAMVADFRRANDTTPILLFGYFNPIYAYGVARFAGDARAAGVDGLLVVDLPPEEIDELWEPARAHDLDVVLLIAPTTDEARARRILAHTTGFAYYVSILGITGTTSAEISSIARAVQRIRRNTALPVAVGFGIKTPADVAAVAEVADAAVVGSALIRVLADQLDDNDGPRDGLVDATLAFVRTLSQALRRPAAGQATG